MTYSQLFGNLLFDQTLDHQFKDIAMYQEAKVRIRLLPTRAEFTEKFGKPPKLLEEAINASPIVVPRS